MQERHSQYREGLALQADMSHQEPSPPNLDSQERRETRQIRIRPRVHQVLSVKPVSQLKSQQVGQLLETEAILSQKHLPPLNSLIPLSGPLKQ